MNKSVHLHRPIANANSERLNLFAGRYLSEQEFDLMQRYVDKRCEDLLLHQIPGIVEGLSINVNNNDGEMSIRVQPGSAIGGDGRAIQLFFPTNIDWPSLLEVYQARVTPPGFSDRPVHGFYYLTLQRSVATVYETDDADPCSRQDLDPLHDSRIETFGTLDLHFINDLDSLMAMDQTRAANRICASQLDKNIFDIDTGAVPLALLKIDTEILQWVDVLAGRYESQPNSTNHTFLKHWQALVEQGMTITDNTANLAVNTGVDFMPSSGPFPENFISNIAGTQSTTDASQWTLPSLSFQTEDLQIELLPIPANTINGIIQNEFNRGHTNLVHRQQDRIRLMVAVDENNYRPNLMDLPSIDTALVEDLYQRYAKAASDYNAWANTFYALYANIDRDVTFTGDAADGDSQTLFDALYKVLGPVNDYPRINTSARRESLGLPVNQPATQTPTDFFNALIAARSERLATGETLPRPYSLPTPSAPNDTIVDPTLNTSPTDGYYRLQADYKAQILAIETDLETSFELIDETSDFISVQRQHLDSITVSFASLAGGVQGDGSGLNLMRWTGAVNILPAADTTPTDV